MSGKHQTGNNSARRGRIDPIWWAPTSFIVVAVLIALTAASFSGTFRQFISLTLVSDRAGLVMEPGAKVKLRGVQIGQVATIGTDVKAAQLQLKMDPGPFQYLPSNLEAEIKSTTAFGSKYVDLVVPENPSRTPLKPGAVLHSRNVTAEVNTVFQNLQSVVQAIDPAKMNAILSAFAESLRGNGARLGEAITGANDLLLTVNPRMETIHRDWRLFGQTTAVYSDAAQNILSILGATAPVRFERALSLGDAYESGALVAYAMNGEPLPLQHGRPVRLIVPGWYSVASVKWLTEIEAIGHPYDGFFQTKRYHYEWERDGRTVREPVRLQRVRALIAEPTDRAAVTAGEVVVRGVACSGAAPIGRVDVSVGGGPWQQARLVGERRRHSWQWWELFTQCEVRGTSTVRARATDQAGNTQPERPEWNRLGYGANAIQTVSIVVE